MATTTPPTAETDDNPGLVTSADGRVTVRLAIDITIDPEILAAAVGGPASLTADTVKGIVKTRLDETTAFVTADAVTRVQLRH